MTAVPVCDVSIGPRQWLGIGISFAGAAVLICHGDLAALLALRLGRGELWMLVAVPVWATYSVLLKRRPASLPERSTLAVSTAFELLWMTPLVLLFPGALRIPWTAARARRPWLAAPAKDPASPWASVP